MPFMMCFRAVRSVLACVLMCCVVSCESKGTAPASAEPPSTSSTRSSERKVDSPPADQKTVVTRLDTAPAVAPVQPGPNQLGPGATPTPEDLQLLKEAEAQPDWPPPGKKLGKNPTVKSFEAFWKPFRAAFIASDMAALEKLSTFPFRALSDSDPVHTVDRSEFPRLVRRLLAQNTGLQDDHESHQQYVKRLHRIHEEHLQGASARVGDLQFGFFDPDGWRFESAWVSDLDESK
jgi:hypothetical protein